MKSALWSIVSLWGKSAWSLIAPAWYAPHEHVLFEVIKNAACDKRAQRKNMKLWLQSSRWWAHVTRAVQIKAEPSFMDAIRGKLYYWKDE